MYLLAPENYYTKRVQVLGMGIALRAEVHEHVDDEGVVAAAARRLGARYGGGGGGRGGAHWE